jgi:TPR repeat protein
MADLRGLNLLRNDPQAAARLLAQAEEGDMDAQYAAGLIYAEGRGVSIDLVQSYFWLSRAIDQGDGDAELLRRQVAVQMSDAEFAAARRLLDAAARAQPPAPDGGTARRH